MDRGKRGKIGGFIKMSKTDVFLTRKGFERLKKELDYLTNVKRRELSEEIGRARGFGDISENAEYDAAKEALAHNEERISGLQDKLSRARIIEDENIPKDKVYIGANVLVKDLDSNEEFSYTIVAEDEADWSLGKISISSPVGKGLLGHKIGDLVNIVVPAGILRYRILNISR